MKRGPIHTRGKEKEALVVLLSSNGAMSSYGAEMKRGPIHTRRKEGSHSSMKRLSAKNSEA
jgi:ABC-type enterochelin transport system substrate-binding protein